MAAAVFIPCLKAKAARQRATVAEAIEALGE